LYTTRRVNCASEVPAIADAVAPDHVVLRFRDRCHPERRVEMSEARIETQQPADTESVSEVEATEITSEEPVLVEGDLLVEDVSIDGMCGVY
jgi:mycofactocin precursor